MDDKQRKLTNEAIAVYREKILSVTQSPKEKNERTETVKNNARLEES